MIAHGKTTNRCQDGLLRAIDGTKYEARGVNLKNKAIDGTKEPTMLSFWGAFLGTRVSYGAGVVERRSRDINQLQRPKYFGCNEPRS